MGNKQPTGKQELNDARKAAIKKVGSIEVVSRYHVLPKLLADDYELAEEELGRGANGGVRLARHKQNGTKHAVKQMKLYHLTPTQRREMKNEVAICLSMDHAHVVRLNDVYEDHEHVQLVMECLEGGELFDRITKLQRFSEREAANTGWQMLLALHYLHSNGIVHRDLKCENFLFESQGSDILKLIDFGMSRYHTPSKKKMQLSCGTIAYMAPEVVAGSYTNRCDLWSFGVIVFILLLGYMPFSGTDEEQLAAISAGEYSKKEPQWSKLSDDARDFLQRLLVVDPDARPSTDEAMAHSWMANRETASTTPLDRDMVNALCQYAAASKFRRVCMSMMAWSLSNKELENIRRAFESMDKDHQGTIMLSELKVALQEHLTSDDQIQGIFSAIDGNGDQEIGYTEFLAATISSRIELHDTLIRDAFRRFDQDGSGFVTTSEIRQVLSGCCSKAEVDVIVQEIDTSKDGKISLDEFMDYIRSDDAKEVHYDAALKLIDNEMASKSKSVGHMDACDSRHPQVHPSEATAVLTPPSRTCNLL